MLRVRIRSKLGVAYEESDFIGLESNARVFALRANELERGDKSPLTASPELFFGDDCGTILFVEDGELFSALRSWLSSTTGLGIWLLALGLPKVEGSEGACL